MEEITRRRLWILGAVSGALCIIFGAFGAHALAGHVSPVMLNAYHTGVSYQMWHTAALMALLAGWRRQRAPAVTLWCWILGTSLFSGSLYVLALSGWRSIGFITPVGGVLMVIGWVSLAVAWWRHD